MSGKPSRRAPASRWPLWLSALAGMLWALVAYAPASWLAGAVAAVTQQRVLLADAHGSWREGSAQCVLSGGPQSRGATLAPGRLHWRIALSGIWHGALGITLDWPELAEKPLVLSVQGNIAGWSVRQQDPANWQAQFPAAVLEGLGTPWNTLALQGRVGLVLQHTRLESSAGRVRLDGSVQADAADMTSRLSTVAPLGSYHLQVDGVGANAKIALSSLAGPLLLKGTGVWNGRQLQFAGSARAQPGQEQSLANLLSLLGQREGDKVRIAL